jgi:hypothetical protein
MTQTEFDDFYKRLFIAFPGLREHVNAKSNQPKATLAVWQRTLAEVAIEEADAVLDDWIEGRASPPAGYERDYTAILIRQRVLHRRSKERALIDNDQRLRQRIEAKQLRQALSGLGVDTAFELCLRANGKLQRGEIDRRQWLVELDQICSKVG